MDERTGQLFISVGRICEDAAVAAFLPVSSSTAAIRWRACRSRRAPRATAAGTTRATRTACGSACGASPLHDGNQITISRPGAPAPTDTD